MNQRFTQSSNDYLKTFYLFVFTVLFSSGLIAQNANNGGTIGGASQSLCLGDTPAMLTSVVEASGGDTNLPLEYLWMTSTTSNIFNITTWDIAPGNNTGSTYQPPVLNETAFYTRCARRQGFPYVAESNIATIEVFPSPAAIIDGNPGFAFTGIQVDFNATSVTGGTYSWDLDGNGIPETSGQNVSRTYNTPGTYTISLTVTNTNGCSTTATSTFTILSSYESNIADPCNCDDPQNIVDLAGQAYYHHDYARIQSNPNDTWTIVSILNVNPNGGDIFNSSLAPIGVGTVIPATNNTGTYQLPLWFNAALGGWSITVQNQNGYQLTTGLGATTNCTICPGSPLPVELVSFDASVNKGVVTLKWVTASESNSSHFIVERSLDGSRFDFVGKTESAGTTTNTQVYSLEDTRSIAGKTYYRLKQVDLDGTYTYSNVISVFVPTKEVIAAVIPNPVVEKAIVRFGENIAPNAEMELISATGALIETYKITNSFQEIDTQNLQPGIYFLRIKNADRHQQAYYKITKL